MALSERKKDEDLKAERPRKEQGSSSRPGSSCSTAVECLSSYQDVMGLKKDGSQADSLPDLQIESQGFGSFWSSAYL